MYLYVVDLHGPTNPSILLNNCTNLKKNPDNLEFSKMAEDRRSLNILIDFFSYTGIVFRKYNEINDTVTQICVLRMLNNDTCIYISNN